MPVQMFLLLNPFRKLYVVGSWFVGRDFQVPSLFLSRVNINLRGSKDSHQGEIHIPRGGILSSSIATDLAEVPPCKIFHPTMRAGANLGLFKSWDLDSRVLRKLQSTCFGPLINLTYFKEKSTLLEAISGVYSTEDGAFRCGAVSLYLGLEDIYFLSGLPVDGRPIISRDYSSTELCLELLGQDDPNRATSNGNLKCRWLKNTFENVPNNIGDEDDRLKPYVRAYILFIIGTVLLPDGEKVAVPILYLHFLRDISARVLNNFAWGAAVHAKLHSCLQKKLKNFKGASWILELFFLERICSIRNAYFKILQEVPSQFPPFIEWGNAMYKISLNPHKEENWQDLLMNVSEEDVIWRPYDRFDNARSQRMFYSCTILFNFETIIYHRPDLAFKQLRIVNLDRSQLKEMKPLKVKSKRGHKDRRLLQCYAEYIKEWDEQRHNTCIKDLDANFVLPDPPQPIVPDEQKHNSISPIVPDEQRHNSIMGDDKSRCFDRESSVVHHRPYSQSRGRSFSRARGKHKQQRMPIQQNRVQFWREKGNSNAATHEEAVIHPSAADPNQEKHQAASKTSVKYFAQRQKYGPDVSENSNFVRENDALSHVFTDSSLRVSTSKENELLEEGPWVVARCTKKRKEIKYPRTLEIEHQQQWMPMQQNRVQFWREKGNSNAATHEEAVIHTSAAEPSQEKHQAASKTSVKYFAQRQKYGPDISQNSNFLRENDALSPLFTDSSSRASTTKENELPEEAPWVVARSIKKRKEIKYQRTPEIEHQQQRMPIQQNRVQFWREKGNSNAATHEEAVIHPSAAEPNQEKHQAASKTSVKYFAQRQKYGPEISENSNFLRENDAISPVFTDSSSRASTSEENELPEEAPWVVVRCIKKRKEIKYLRTLEIQHHQQQMPSQQNRVPFWGEKGNSNAATHEEAVIHASAAEPSQEKHQAA